MEWKRIREEWPIIRERSLKNGSVSYQIDLGEQDGHRRREEYPNREVAEAKAEFYAEQRRRLGTETNLLPAREVHEYVDCRNRLAAVNATVPQATDYYIKNVVPFLAVPKLREICQMAVDEVRKKKRSADHIRGLVNFYDDLVGVVGDVPLHQLTVEQLQNFCLREGLADKTYNDRRGDLIRIYRRALRKNWTPKNTASEIIKFDLVRGEIEFFRPDPIRRLLLHAHEYDLLPAIVLAVFAGVRQSEIMKLSMDYILGSESIRITAAVSKTKWRRTIELDDTMGTFKEWLKLFRHRQGRVVCKDYIHRMSELRKAAGITPWIKNGLRHAFATYYSKLNGEIRAADVLGNSIEILQKHYRGHVLRPEADEYFALTPRAVFGDRLPEIVATVTAASPPAPARRPAPSPPRARTIPAENKNPDNQYMAGSVYAAIFDFGSSGFYHREEIVEHVATALNRERRLVRMALNVIRFSRHQSNHGRSGFEHGPDGRIKIVSLVKPSVTKLELVA